MEYTSAGFEGQAASDLRSAQAIARDCQSGHALATAMFLAQQSMEKNLKSAILRLDENLRIGLGEGFYRNGLGHTIYARPDLLYLNCLKGIGFPRGLDDRDALESAYAGFYDHVKMDLDRFKKFGKSSGPELFSQRIQDLLLLHCLRVRLPDGELRELDTYARKIFEAMHAGDPAARRPSRFANREPKAGMLAILTDGALLKRLRLSHYQDDSRVIDLSDNENLVMSLAQKAQNIEEGRKAGKVSPKVAKRLVGVVAIQYAVISLAWFAGSYLRLLPHSTRGRYPRTLHNGRSTTEVYASQLDNVLYEVFVVADYNHMRISWMNIHIDGLCGVRRGVGHDVSVREGWLADPTGRV